MLLLGIPNSDRAGDMVGKLEAEIELLGVCAVFELSPDCELWG